MLHKGTIAIDISNDRIIILVGKRTVIKKSAVLKIPQGICENDRIVDLEAVGKVIGEWLITRKPGTKDVVFNAKGEDIITRHATLPLIAEAPMRDAVEWELRQFLGDRTDEYYFDYEIIKVTGEGKVKNADVIIVAAEKNKIRSYLTLAEKLGLNLKGIDTYATSGARALRNSKVAKNNGTLGVVTIDSGSSSFFILNNGDLAIEKYHNIGILSGTGDKNNSVSEYDSFLSRLDIASEEGAGEDIKAVKAVNAITSYFNSLIQFFTSGKVKKNLDKIYLLGSASKIKGLKEKFSSVFKTDIADLDDFNLLKYKVKSSGENNLDECFYSYGLLLESPYKKLNLVPYSIRSSELKNRKKIVYISVAVLILVILAGGFGFLKYWEFHLNSVKADLQKKVAANEEKANRLNKIEDGIKVYTAHISKVKKLSADKDQKTDDLILYFEKLMPEEIVVSSFNLDGSNISVIGISTTYEKIDEFWANLREDSKFRNSYVSNMGKVPNGVSFTLTTTYAGGGTDGKY